MNAEHKPSAAGAVDKRIEFKYDVLNNRMQKSVDADGDGAGAATVVKFAYDSNGNAWADLTSAGSLPTRRLYNDAVDALLAKIDAATGATTWYLTDNLGSVRDLTDASGTLTDHLDYNSFGKLTYESVPGASDRYQSTGREVDVEIEMRYHRARYFDLNTNRWVSQDPIGFDAGDSNLYRNVHNTPTMATDPSGLWGRWGPRNGPIRQLVFGSPSQGLYPTPLPSSVSPIMPYADELGVPNFLPNLAAGKVQISYYPSQDAKTITLSDVPKSADGTAGLAVELKEIKDVKVSVANVGRGNLSRFGPTWAAIVAIPNSTIANKIRDTILLHFLTRPEFTLPVSAGVSTGSGFFAGVG